MRARVQSQSDVSTTSATSRLERQSQVQSEDRTGLSDEAKQPSTGLKTIVVTHPESSILNTNRNVDSINDHLSSRGSTPHCSGSCRHTNSYTAPQNFYRDDFPLTSSKLKNFPWDFFKTKSTRSETHESGDFQRILVLSKESDTTEVTKQIDILTNISVDYTKSTWFVKIS